MKGPTRARRANGLVVALILGLLAVHAVLGSLSTLVPIPKFMAWMIWVGVALIVVHMSLSVATSYEQLTDYLRPPSAAKRRHLGLKWLTGLVLALIALIHISPTTCPLYEKSLMVALAAATAWHVYVGARSLLSDLGCNKDRRSIVRAAALAIAAVSSLIVLLGQWQ